MLEVVLSIALIAALMAISIPIYRTLIMKNDLDVATIETVQSMRRAQLLSQAVDGDTAWGVYIQSQSITLFQGISYASRATGYDEVFDVPDTIAPSGTQEFVYDKFTGLPQSTGTLTFTSNDGDERTISLNAQGTITY